MMEKLFQVTKWVAIIFLVPTVLFAVLDFADTLLLDGSLGDWITPSAQFCFRVLAASFIVAVVLAMADTRGGKTEE